ncbi:sugar ABC transporter ATP-binding protein [Brevibacillus centrosporus]|uniref:sugar ABC transporter ATP-binding protein n=1 Tax=Brevibacillus centrosporus TaxID=54910 RepID=UPI002E2475A7|nr:sugar ABC transporter ATP-binding protein [Brevibacillus centrosporus]
MNEILTMQDISKSFPGVKALQNVDFSVNKGEVHCLIGANGAGKSTLMKILAGVYPKDTGEIYLEGEKVHISSPADSKRLGVITIHQELSLVEHLTVAENIYLGSYATPRFGIVSWKRLRRQAQALIDRLGIAIDVNTPVSELSMGHKQIVELAKALEGNAKVIIMDEPSTTLSEREIRTLFAIIEELIKQGITIIYISHKLEELFAIGDRVTVLRDGKWVATQALSELDQTSLTELIIGYKMEKHERSAEERNFPELLRAEGLQTRTISNVSFTLGKGEVLGLYGLVGAGRTELLKALYGVDPLISGSIYLEGKGVKIDSPSKAIHLGMGLVPENRKTEGAILGLSVEENAILPAYDQFASGGVINPGRIRTEIANRIRELNVKTPDSLTLMGNLSGGNQQKVIISKWLIRKSQIILFDEPTQGVDIGAKQEIYKIIRRLVNEGTSVIVASSEINELQEICNRILVMFRGTVVGEFRDPQQQKEDILNHAVTGGTTLWNT